MTTGDIQPQYAASSDLTVTNLNSLAASTTWVAGWESALIDNTTVRYSDYSVTAKITAGAASAQIGEIRMYLAEMLDDSTWPDVLDGTESVETFTSANVRDGCCVIGATTATDATNNRVYYMDCPSVRSAFNGKMPAKFVIFIAQTAHSTTVAIAASGNQVTVKGTYDTVAA